MNKPIIIVLLFLIFVVGCKGKFEGHNNAKKEIANLSSQDLKQIAKEKRIKEKIERYKSVIPSFVKNLLDKNYQAIEGQLDDFVALKFYMTDGSRLQNTLEGKVNILEYLQENNELSKILLGGEHIGYSLDNPNSIEYGSGATFSFDVGEITFYVSKDRLIEAIICKFGNDTYFKAGYSFNPSSGSDVWDNVIRYNEKKILYGPFYAPFSDYATIEFYDDETFLFVEHGLEGISVYSGLYTIEKNILNVRCKNRNEVFKYVLNTDGTLSTLDNWFMIFAEGGKETVSLLKGMRYNFKTFEYYETPILD